MRRIFLLLAMMAATLVVTSGVSPAATPGDPDRPLAVDRVYNPRVVDLAATSGDKVIDDDVIDTLLGLLQADELYGKAGDDAITGTNNEDPGLVVQNKRDGVALRPLVKPGESPMAVNSDVKVTRERSNIQEEHVGFNFGKVVLSNSSWSKGQSGGQNEIRFEDAPGDDRQLVDGFIKIGSVVGESDEG